MTKPIVKWRSMLAGPLASKLLYVLDPIHNKMNNWATSVFVDNIARKHVAEDPKQMLATVSEANYYLDTALGQLGPRQNIDKQIHFPFFTGTHLQIFT